MTEKDDNVATKRLAYLDPEKSPLSQYHEGNDPLQLSSRLKTTSEIDSIRANTSRKRDGCGPITVNKDAYKARRLQKFYEAQNDSINQFLKPVEDHVDEARKFQGDNHLKFKIAVHGSFAANVLLAVLQLYAAISSGSLSLFTTMADALFDPMSNITLIACNRAVRRVDPRRFPSGKARIETAGNIVFCFLMTAVSFILIAISAEELASGYDKNSFLARVNNDPLDGPASPKITQLVGSFQGTIKFSNSTLLTGDYNLGYTPPPQVKEFHLASVIAVAVAFCTKLALFAYCWALRNSYSQIRILWEDHRNDLFINGAGLATSILSTKQKWWIDPLGAIVLSCLISSLWLHTAYKEFQLLIGVTADTRMQQWITYISMMHSDMITGIDTVRAYHSGPRIIVEVDVVMGAEERLRDVHDVAEDLQIKLESLPDVERAYVHIDFETSHKPEHFLKKEL